MGPRIGLPPRWTRARAEELARRWNEGQPKERIAAAFGFRPGTIGHAVATLRKRYPELGFVRRAKGPA